MEKEKGRERVRDGGHGVLEKYFSVFTCCSRSVFLYLYGVLDGERHLDAAGFRQPHPTSKPKYSISSFINSHFSSLIWRWFF